MYTMLCKVNFILEIHKVNCTIFELQILINSSKTNTTFQSQFMTSVTLLHVSAPGCHPYKF